MTTLQERLGPYLESIGLTPQPKPGALNYAGELNGRTLKVHCSMRRRTRYAGEVRYSTYAGHQLSFNLSTPIATRLNLFEPAGGFKGLVARTNSWFGTQKLTHLGSAYDHLEVWAYEPIWAEQFLAQAEVQKLVHDLLPPGELAPAMGLKLWPNRWTFAQRIAAGAITPIVVAHWVTTFDRLAELAERNPPLQTVEPTRWEMFTTDQPFVAACLIIGGLMALFSLPVICCTILFIALAATS